jgi:hypothetical protein
VTTFDTPQFSDWNLGTALEYLGTIAMFAVTPLGVFLAGMPVRKDDGSGLMPGIRHGDKTVRLPIVQTPDDAFRSIGLYFGEHATRPLLPSERHRAIELVTAMAAEDIWNYSNEED